jgi:adenylate cyclase
MCICTDCVCNLVIMNLIENRDIASFTEFCTSNPTRECVKLLKVYFSCFDDLCTKYGVEKVKTIGDAYFCIGGLIHPETFSNIVFMAQEMITCVDKLNTLYGWKVSIRVGIASGKGL